jgi:hypothetical protein
MFSNDKQRGAGRESFHHPAVRYAERRRGNTGLDFTPRVPVLSLHFLLLYRAGFGGGPSFGPGWAGSPSLTVPLGPRISLERNYQ